MRTNQNTDPNSPVGAPSLFAPALRVALNRYRTNHRTSISAMAKQFQMSEAHLRGVMLAGSEPTITVIERMARAMELTVSEFSAFVETCIERPKRKTKSAPTQANGDA